MLLFSVGYAINTTLAPALGLPLNPQAAAEDEKVLSASLHKIESFWLQGNGRFLLGSTQPSIADISLVCELMQLEVRKYCFCRFLCCDQAALAREHFLAIQVVYEKDRERILSPYKRVLNWIDDTKKATAPHFDEIHTVLFKVKARLQKQRSAAANLHSKM